MHCDNEAQYNKVQEIAKKMSGILLLDAGNIIKNAPLIEKNERTIKEMFKTVTTGGLSLGNLMKVASMVSKIKK